MKLLVIGAGYVGLVTATCFAEVGYHVTCLDIDQEKIAGLHKGVMPIYEIGLQEMVLRNTKAGRLHFSTDYAQTVPSAQICFICVDTPSDEHGGCDLSKVRRVAHSLASHMDEGCIVVIKSTAPIGTSEQVKRMIQKDLKTLGRNVSFSIASNPEFLKEGCAIGDFMKPDRVIIGVEDPKLGSTLSELYAPFNLNHDRILVVDLRSSEMIKYASNAMLATRISFMNELAGLCERLGADINRVRRGLGSDSRIGHAFLYAGVGFGGSCFPKDIRALRALAHQAQYPTQILDAVDLVNRRQKYVLSQKVIQYYGKKATPTLAVWGLSFKPDTDDMREAPSLTFIQELWTRGYTLRLYDPVSQKSAAHYLKEMGIGPDRIHWCDSEYHAAEQSDGIALLTEWKQLRQVDFESLSKQVRHRVIFDGRNQYRSQELSRWGFDHLPIGRANNFEKNNSDGRHEDAACIPPLVDVENI